MYHQQLHVYYKPPKRPHTASQSASQLISHSRLPQSPQTQGVQVLPEQCRVATLGHTLHALLLTKPKTCPVRLTCWVPAYTPTLYSAHVQYAALRLAQSHGRAPRSGVGMGMGFGNAEGRLWLAAGSGVAGCTKPLPVPPVLV